MCECVKHLGLYYSKKKINWSWTIIMQACISQFKDIILSIYLVEEMPKCMHKAIQLNVIIFKKLNLNAQFKVYIGVKFYAI